jgi:hypothetical protein
MLLAQAVAGAFAPEGCRMGERLELAFFVQNDPFMLRTVVHQIVHHCDTHKECSFSGRKDNEWIGWL